MIATLSSIGNGLTAHQLISSHGGTKMSPVILDITNIALKSVLEAQNY